MPKINFIKRAGALILVLALLINVSPLRLITTIHGASEYPYGDYLTDEQPDDDEILQDEEPVIDDEPVINDEPEIDEELSNIYEPPEEYEPPTDNEPPEEYEPPTEEDENDEYEEEDEYEEDEEDDEYEEDDEITEPLIPIMPLDGPLHTVSSPADLTLAWEAAGDITIVLANSFQMAGQLTVVAGRHITITSDGGAHTLTSANNTRHFSVANGGTLTLGVLNAGAAGGNNFTLQGQGIVASGGGSITVAGNAVAGTGGTLTMYGGTITGARNSGSVGGGAIHLGGAAIFDMYDGAITGNTTYTTSSGGGGAIHIVGESIFNMYGGTLSNNVATAGGGGAIGSPTSAIHGVIVNMYGGQIINNRSESTHENHGGGAVFLQGTDSVFTMHSGAVIHNNTATFGGGVRIRPINPSEPTHVHFHMLGGTISGNTSTSTGASGGGVHLAHQSAGSPIVPTVFVMEGGSISGNTALGNGGGIATSSSSSNGVIIDMQGGEIAHNVSQGSVGGGGVFLQGARSVLTIHHGAVIHNNTATSGGGVRFNISSAPSGGAPGAVFNLNGGVIHSNTAVASATSGTGGGVHLNVDTTFNFTSGEIRDNIANGHGGGVATSSGNRITIINMTGGEISNNRAGGLGGGGGGVFLQGTGSELNISGSAIISHNHAEHGGGVRANAGSTINMTGGAIRNNTTNTTVNDLPRVGRGGGVMIVGSNFNMNGGVLEHNTAGTFGGAVNLDAGDGTINITGGTIANNQAVSGGGVGFNISATMDHNPFIPFMERVTIGSAAIFSGNTATSGLSENTELRDMFAGNINPAIFTNHDLHTPSQGRGVYFIAIDENGNEIVLHYVAVMAGANFTNTHVSQFPTSATIRAEVEYHLWPNQYSTGFNEWGFTNRWRVDDPVTGQLIDLNSTPVSFSIPVPDTGVRLYAQIEQLLIVDDASLREAVSRVEPNVPAVLVMQNGFDATQDASVMIPGGCDITLTGVGGNNYTYFRDRGNTGHNVAQQRHFIVQTGATLCLNNITVQGNLPNTNIFHGGVLVEEGARLYVNEGTIIENNRAIYGGGIFLRVPMPAVSNNPTTQPQTGGGGVVVIDGATIRGNTAAHFGGGINVTGFIIDHPVYATQPRPPEQENIVVIRGDTRIHNNFAHYAGGGVMVSHFAHFTMENGQIFNNSTRGWGGGIRFHNGGSLTVHDGTITNNTANYGGGGIAGGGGVGGGYNFEDMPGTARFDLHGGAISNNNVTGAVDPGYAYSSFLGGGGVMVDGLVTFSMNGGEIYENTVPIARVPSVPFGENPFGMGGGVFLNHGATFIINDGVIRDNQAYRGGGIHVATIENYAYHRTWLHAHNARITGNAATENGGGIFATHYTNIEVSDQVIFNNNTAVSLHSFFMYPTFGGTNIVSAGTHSGEGQGGYAGINVDWGTVSVFGTHALNNYDINFIFSESPPTRFLRVVFNPNGGQFAGDIQLPVRLVEFYGTYETAFNASDDVVNPALAQPTRAGYTFGGWFNSEAEANNLASQNGRILYSHDVTNIDMRMLWARWTPVPGYTPAPTPTPTPGSGQQSSPSPAPSPTPGTHRPYIPSRTPGPNAPTTGQPTPPYDMYQGENAETTPPGGTHFPMPPPWNANENASESALGAETNDTTNETTPSPVHTHTTTPTDTHTAVDTVAERQNPQTGDDFDMLKVLSLAIMCVMSLAGVLGIRKRARAVK